MKIVIDINEETYEYWKEHKYEYVLAEAIANGTPLPKGKWIQAKDEDGIEIYREILCSRCNKASVERFPFCPNCGAQMKGGARGRSK